VRLLLDGSGGALPLEALGWASLRTSPVRLVVARPVSRDAAGTAAAEDRLGEALPGAAVACGVLPEDPALAVAIAPADADVEGVRAAVLEAETFGGAGVGDAAELDDAASLQRSLTRARRALSAAGSGVRRYDELGSGLEALLDPGAADAWAAALVAPLDEPGERADLAATVLAWLRRHGQVDAAAADLGVHRHTVRHRLRRAESLLGRSLDDAGVRAELYLALTRLPE
jgi:purine catabolism regulator